MEGKGVMHWTWSPCRLPGIGLEQGTHWFMLHLEVILCQSVCSWNSRTMYWSGSKPSSNLARPCEDPGWNSAPWVRHRTLPWVSLELLNRHRQTNSDLPSSQRIDRMVGCPSWLNSDSNVAAFSCRQKSPRVIYDLQKGRIIIALISSVNYLL